MTQCSVYTPRLEPLSWQESVSLKTSYQHYNSTAVIINNKSSALIAEGPVRHSDSNRQPASYTPIALLDLSSAFDCVTVSITTSFCQGCNLLLVLGVLCCMAWVRSFLTDRSQRVFSGDCLSDLIFLLFGVPQGSVLGPLLFLLYVACLLYTSPSPRD